MKPMARRIIEEKPCNLAKKLMILIVLVAIFTAYFYVLSYMVG